MARFGMTGLDALVADMQKKGQHSGEVAMAMTAAAAQVIQETWRESAQKHELIDTGAMINSIGYPKGVQRINDLYAVDIYPQGKDASGTRNADKAFVLNYGTSKFKATYWIDEADQASEPRIVERLQNMWNGYLETGQVPSIPLRSSKGGKGTKTIKT